MKKTAFLIMLVTILSKIIGFVRDITLSYFYGASTVSDVFLISQQIPNTLFSLIGTAVMMGFIPIASRLYESRPKEEADRFTNAMLTAVVLIACAVIAFGLVFTRPIISLFAIGFTEEALDLAVSFTRILIWGLLANAVLFVLRGFLQVKERYVITTMLGFPYNLVLITGIALSATIDIRILPVEGLLALFAQLLLFIPDLIKLDFTIRPTLDFDKALLKDFIRFVLPVVIASGVTQLAMIVDRTLASSVGVGGISALQYANRLNGFVLGLFITSLITVLYPMMARMAASGDTEKLKESVNESVVLISLFVIPISIGAILLAGPIVDLLFGRGAFDERALQMTSTALIAYALGMLPTGLREVFSKAFYAIEESRIPMRNSMITAVIQIGLSFLLYRPLGLMGIPLAASIASAVSVLLYGAALRNTVGYRPDRAHLVTLLKLLTASAAMGIAVVFLYRSLVPVVSPLFSLALTVLPAMLLYAVCLYVLRVKEIQWILQKVKKRIRS